MGGISDDVEITSIYPLYIRLYLLVFATMYGLCNQKQYYRIFVVMKVFLRKEILICLHSNLVLWLNNSLTLFGCCWPLKSSMGGLCHSQNKKKESNTTHRHSTWMKQRYHIFDECGAWHFQKETQKLPLIMQRFWNKTK